MFSKRLLKQSLNMNTANLEFLVCPYFLWPLHYTAGCNVDMPNFNS